VVGCLLLSGATLAGLLLIHRPWANRIDAIGLRLLPADLSSRWASDLVRLGSVPFLVVAVAALVLVALSSRDRVGALSCVVAPVVAVTVVELVAKPLVGRHIDGTSAYSYPSGTVTAIAALAAGAVVVAPSVTRRAVTGSGGILVIMSCAAVVVLRWHFPTDALGGAAVGVGAVFAFDGLVRLISPSMLSLGRSP
jgi:membrane-associated phospholipid phosphatase